MSIQKEKDMKEPGYNAQGYEGFTRRSFLTRIGTIAGIMSLSPSFLAPAGKAEAAAHVSDLFVRTFSRFDSVLMDFGGVLSQIGSRPEAPNTIRPEIDVAIDLINSGGVQELITFWNTIPDEEKKTDLKVITPCLKDLTPTLESLEALLRDLKRVVRQRIPLDQIGNVLETFGKTLRTAGEEVIECSTEFVEESTIGPGLSQLAGIIGAGFGAVMESTGLVAQDVGGVLV
jgi:hypothetical protein